MQTNDISSEFKNALDKAWAAAKKAVEIQDIRGLEAATKSLVGLDKMTNEIAQRIRALDPNAAPANEPKEPELREILIEVTEGAINQNLLSVTQALKERKLKVGEVLKIKAIPSGRTFTSNVLGAGNKLQERGEIGRFYRDAGVKPGNYVLLKEKMQGYWDLFKPEKQPEPFDYASQV